MDLDDLVDAADEIEEVAGPEDLLSDLAESPALVAVALLAAGAAVFTLVMVALAVVVAFVFGVLWVVVALALLGLFATIGGVVLFLYLRTDVPDEVSRRIDEARRQADDTPRTSTGMSEQEAVEELGELYATGELDDHELDQALEDALTSEEPARVVRRYEQQSDPRSRAYEYEYE